MIRKRTKHGFTLIELAAAMFIMLISFSAIVPMIHSTSVVWNKGTAQNGNKDLLDRAILKMSPTMRNALLVDVANSTPHKLVLILPKVDATGTGYITPLQNGNSVAFYLSDLTGDPTKTGTILWESINSVPQKTWALRSGKAGIDFGVSNLTFSFDNSGDPSMVTITAYSTQWAGNKPLSATSVATVLLRNHKIGGL